MYENRTASARRRTTGPAVLIVDDDPSARRLLRFALEQSGYTVSEVESAERALTALPNCAPAAVIVDWVLPGMSGLSLVARLRQSPLTSQLALIMVSAHGGADERAMGLDQGADDYLTKPFGARELIARIRAVARRRCPDRATACFSAGELRYEAAAQAISLCGTRLPLRSTEFKLLKILIEHGNQVLSRSRLLDLIWGETVFVEERTVDVHVRRLRKVLNRYSEDVVIRAVRGGGYKLLTPVSKKTVPVANSIANAHAAALSDVPIALTGCPVAVADRPIAVADRPIAVADRPIAVADRPIAVADRPIPVAERPIGVAERPGRRDVGATPAA